MWPSLSPALADPRNTELIRLLQADPRSSIAALARRMRMSAPAVRERMMRLEEAGIVRGYRLDLDPASLGLPITIYVRVRPMPGHLPRIAELAQATPQVVECHRITGEDCFILKVCLDAIESLDRILDPLLAHGQTTTSIVQSSPVPPRDPPLPANGTARLA